MVMILDNYEFKFITNVIEQVVFNANNKGSRYRFSRLIFISKYIHLKYLQNGMTIDIVPPFPIHSTDKVNNEQLLLRLL